MISKNTPLLAEGNTEPPNGYRVAWPTIPDSYPHPHTADGVKLENGLAVFTNNLDRGTVNLDGAHWEWYPSEGIYHLWFDVNVDTTYDGKAVSRVVSQSEDRVATVHPPRRAKA